MLRLLLDGRDVAQVGSALNLSPKTVRNLHCTIKRKLGVRDDIELMRLAMRLDVIDLLGVADTSTV